MNKPVKLMFFIPSLGTGGAERQVLRLANNLNRLKFETSIVVARSKGNYERYLRNSIKLHILSNSNNSSTISMLFAIPKLKLLLKQEVPDILFPLLSHSIIVAEKALYGLGLKTKLVAGVQNNLTKELLSKPTLIKFIFKKLLLKALRNSHRIIALSNGVFKDIVKIDSILTHRIRLIYNAGIDSELDCFEIKSIEKIHKLTLVACGRLEPQKDYVTMLLALAKILESEKSVLLWILGAGSLEKKLKKTARQLGIIKNVRFWGFIDNPFNYIGSADIFVMSSIFEGFGNVIVEAMALGTPVVSTNCDFGPGEIMEHMKTGLLVEVGNPNKLAEAILMLHRNSILKEEISKNAQVRALDFHINHISVEYEKMFLELLGKNYE